MKGSVLRLFIYKTKTKNIADTNNRKAIVFILIATLSFAVMNALAKYLTDFNPFEIAFFRAFGSFVFLFPYMLIKKIPILGTHRKIMALRSVIGFSSLVAFFAAIQMMPFGSAVSIRYIGPLISVVLAYFILKEKVKLLQWISFIVAIIGVFILKGFDFRIDQTGFFLVLFSAFALGCVFMMVRYLATREHHLTIINYFMSITIILSLCTISYWKIPVGIEWIYFVAMGITGLIGQVFMTIALKLGETNTVAPFKYMELVYALIFGFFIFGEAYTIAASIGILLIIFAMILNVVAKRSSKEIS